MYNYHQMKPVNTKRKGSIVPKAPKIAFPYLGAAQTSNVFFVLFTKKLSSVKNFLLQNTKYCFPSVDAARGLVAKGNLEVCLQVSMSLRASSPRETV